MLHFNTGLFVVCYIHKQNTITIKTEALYELRFFMGFNNYQCYKVRAKKHRDRIADQRFLSALHFYHTTHSQLFITNDKKLQADLATAAKTASVNGKPVYVASIENGLLKRFELPEPEISYEPSYESGDNSAICLIGGLFLGVVVTSLTSIIRNKLS